MSDKHLDYWNTYYESRGHSPTVPSQFASFVLNEFSDRQDFIDVGCGNGRDSIFFNNFGKSVLAIDGSEKVIKLNKSVAEDFGWKIKFELCDFSSDSSINRIVKEFKKDYSRPVIHSRFFIHAIGNEEIEKFLDFSQLMMGEQGVLCLEYRTDKDSALEKVTETHFRNYINPKELEMWLESRNMKSTYFCEGLGYAKYKTDDAFVARHIIQRA